MMAISMMQDVVKVFADAVLLLAGNGQRKIIWKLK